MPNMITGGTNERTDEIGSSNVVIMLLDVLLATGIDCMYTDGVGCPFYLLTGRTWDRMHVRG